GRAQHRAQEARRPRVRALGLSRPKAVHAAIASLVRSATVRGVRALRDWLFTVPFLIAFGATLLVFDVAQRVARLFGGGPHAIVAGALQWTLVKAFGICGARLEVERSPLVRPRTPYLIVANHQSMFDIPIFGALLFTNFPKYVSKRSLARWIPSISYNL